MSEILYNFAQNADSIQGHVSGVNEIESIREEIKQHFVTLAEVYGGQGAEALQVKHNSIDRLLSEAEDQARVMATGPGFH
jgi:hypothetical protein